MKAVEDILKNSLFYPACGEDGLPVKSFNEHFTEYGIDSYVYIDYAMNADRLKSIQNGFRYYHVVEEKELEENELVVSGTDYMQYAAILTPEEIAKLEETVYERYVDTIKPFGRMIEYERNDDADPSRGPESFTLLYIGAEAVAAYAALYRTRGIAPKAIAIIAPGTGFGGNYTDFYDPDSALLKLIRQGESQPEYILLGYDKVMKFKTFLESTNRINVMEQRNTFNDFIKNHLHNLSKKSSYDDGIDWYDETYNRKDYAKNFFSPIKDSDPELYANLEFLHQAEYKCLNRRQVFDLLRQEGNEYLGFIAVMVWGGLGTGLSAEDSFEAVLASNNKTVIEAKIKYLKEIMSNQNIEWKERVETAYNYLSNPDTKIPGISTSYFTKILYFLTFENNEVTPLIFDNQSKRIHAALLKDAEALFGKYSIGYDSKKTFYCEIEGVRKSNWNKFDFYWDYITRMKSIADEYSIESGRLEEILFAKKLNSKGAKVKDKNGIPVWPRWFVRKYIDSKIESSQANVKRTGVAKHKRDRNINILGPREVLSINSHELVLYVGQDKKGYLCKYMFMDEIADKHEVFNGSSVLTILHEAQRTKKNYDYQYCHTLEDARNLFEQVKAEILRLQQE